MAALAPGMEKTGTPARMAAWTICAPGSAMPGVPASETTAMRAPAFSSADELFGAAGFVEQVVADRGSVEVEVVKELAVWRVSSQAILSA